jgi:DNA-binding MarR family transcriptional regulator
MKYNPREKSIGAQMAIALQLMKRKNHQAIANAGYKITMEQLAVLEILNFQGDINMTELSNTVWKQNANITRIVDKLETRNLVVRKAIAWDRRAYLICITDEGKDLFYKEIVSCITKEEETITRDSIKKIINSLS